MVLSPQYSFDVFLSYSHANKTWVYDWLLPRLEAAGLLVCIDIRNFDIGVPVLVNMERAVATSRCTLLVLTPAWVASEWTTFEALLVQMDDPSGLRRRTLPLLLQPCQPPRRIAMLSYADFTHAERWDAQLQRVLAAVRGELSLPDVGPALGDVPELKQSESHGQRNVLPEGQPRAMDEKAIPPKADPARNWPGSDRSGGVDIHGGHIQVGGDIVGRDKIVHGDSNRIDSVGAGSAVAMGPGAAANVTTGISSDVLDQLFQPLMYALRDTPPERRDEAVEKAKALKAEVAKGKEADDSKVAKLIDGLVGLVPSAVSSVVSIFASPILAGIAGPVTKYVLDKLSFEQA